MFGLTILNSMKIRDLNNVMESARLLELKKAYKKLHCKIVVELRDSSWWRMT